jgi:HJR/Mrr/RecB family endonuclease
VGLPPFQNRSVQQSHWQHQQSWATAAAVNSRNQHQRNVALLAILGASPEQSEEFINTDLVVPETRLEIARLAPGFGVLTKILSGGIHLDGLKPREFEELIAELLQKSGYEVKIGKGSKDGGVDVLAFKEIEELGLVASVWQAKKYASHRRVGLSVIKELAETRREQNATKGVIATTTYLTSGALDKVTRERYTLNKFDRDDILRWVEDIARR